MFYIYADGKLLNQPLEDSLHVISPKLTLEMGKAGSLEFSIPPNNVHYNALRKLKTIATVELDETEIFRGRVLSYERNFNNVKKFYVEGDLSYLVDSVQKPEKYIGTTHDLFRRIIAAHNTQMNPAKQFAVGIIDIENREIVISGRSNKTEDPDSGAFDYRQIAINYTTNDWPSTYDYIETALIEYCGGYLRTRRVGGTTYLDLVKDYGSSATQDIEFGTNILDLTEEATAEEVFTVLIPIGDNNLTIASVNGGSDELIDTQAVELYGRIVKTHVFQNVNQASTLLENARRFMENHENVPITFTIKAVDLHLINPDVQEIHIGDSVNVKSAPHGISGRLICTRIEYDLERPSNNTYTFGTPKQTLTQRYREDKRKDEAELSGGKNASGAGGASSAAAEKVQKNLDEIYDAWISPDPEAGTVSLGALHKLMKEGKEVLLTQVGIDLDADPDDPTSPNINIRTLHNQVNDVDGRLTNSAAQIQAWSTDVMAKITQQAKWSETLGNEINSLGAQLTLEANKTEGAIAKLEATHNSMISDLELRVTEQESSALMKATYDVNRTADLKLISDTNASVAKLRADHDGKLASLELKANNLASTVVLKANYDKDIATIRATATAHGTSISANADFIALNASKCATLNTKVANINADIVNINAEITNVKSLIAEEISAVKADVTWLQAKTLKVTGLTAENLYANNYVSAPNIRMGGATVATENYVNEKIKNLASTTWIDAQGFATKTYVDDRNAWGSNPATGQRWCKVGGTNVLVSLANHTHSYCTEARVRELIAAATISWNNISGKPSAFYPTSHRHSFSFSKSIANGHVHKVKVGSTTYTTQGVSVNATHSISVSGSTGYAGG